MSTRKGLRGDVLALVSFFSAAFYNFFDGLVLFRTGRSRGRAGRAVVYRFSGRQRCRVEIRQWEGVVEMSSVLSVDADVSFVAGASECRARRETARQTGKESSGRNRNGLERRIEIRIELPGEKRSIEISQADY